MSNITKWCYGFLRTLITRVDYIPPKPDIPEYGLHIVHNASWNVSSCEVHTSATTINVFLLV